MTGTDRLSSHTSSPTVDYYMSADQHSQSIPNNTSVVRCYIRAVNRGNTSTFYADSDANVLITVAGQGPLGASGAAANLAGGTANGATFWEYGPYDITVAHGADGVGAAELTFSVSYPDAASGGGSVWAWLALTPIPRATTPTLSASTVAVGGSVNVVLAPASAGFSHRVWYSFGAVSNKNAGLSGGGGSASGTDGTNAYWATGTGNRTVALAVPVNMARQMAGLASQPLTVYVDTYSGASKIGSTKTINVSVTPAGGVVYNQPTVSATVFRSLSDGTPDDDGVCATLEVTAAVSSINTGSQQNALTYLWEVFNGTWQTLATATPGGLTLTAVEYTYTDSNPGTGGTQIFDLSSSYDFRLTVTDAIGGSGTQTVSMTTAAAILDIYDEPGQPVGVGIGSMYNSSVGGRIQIDGAAALTFRRNRIINGNFRTNQRAYASATSLGSGVYNFDRWKTYTASNSLTFTAAPQGQLVTISSSDEIGQIIERANMEAGDFVLSWTGTAIGRIYKSGATPPSYAAGPLTYTNDGLADVVVQFQASGGTRTVGQVQVESGSIPTPYEVIPLSEELALCQRYYIRFTPGVADSILALGAQQSTVVAWCLVDLPVPLRTKPTVAHSNCVYSDFVGFNVAITGFTTTSTSTTGGSKVSMTVGWTGANGAINRPGGIKANTTGAYLEFTAEL